MEIRPIISALLRNKTAPLLIAAQVALTLAIICNAVYIIRDRLALSGRPSGVQENEVSEIRLYPTRKVEDIKGMVLRDLEAIRSIPGVKSAASLNQVALGRSAWVNGGLSANRDDSRNGVPGAMYQSGESLIDALGLRLVEGRDFLPEEIVDLDPEKDRGNPPVAIVTEALAKAMFPDRTDFAGQTFYLGGGADDPGVRIVGVVERLQTPAAQSGRNGEFSVIQPNRLLVPYLRYVIRSEPNERARVMKEVEKSLMALRDDRVLQGNRTMEAIREGRYAGEKLMAGLLIAVTAFLMMITASGIVGMASLWVNQRRKQIGVRRALGAQRVDIVRYFLVENVLIVSAGVVVGLLLALLLNDQLVRHLEVARLPAAYLGLGMLAMWVLGLVAVLAPALRAASVPPAVATRTA